MSGYDGMDASLSVPLQRLIAASGGQIGIASGFRTPERQAQLFAAAVKKYGSEKAARKYVAPPGKSNHNKGVAADLQFNTPEARKLAHQLAPQFGLIFPMDYEPWHIEPVGAHDKADPAAYVTPTGNALHPQDPNYMATHPQVSAAHFAAALSFTPEQEEAIAGGFPGDVQEQTTTAPDTGQPMPAVSGPPGSSTVDRFLAQVKKHESGGNYKAQNPHASASGAYQIIDSTWNHFGGYARAKDAPPEVQDAKARQMLAGAQNMGPAEWSAIWYIGHVPKSEKEWNTVPHPEAGNKQTPRQYANWIINAMASGGGGTNASVT